MLSGTRDSLCFIGSESRHDLRLIEWRETRSRDVYECSDGIIEEQVQEKQMRGYSVGGWKEPSGTQPAL